MSLKIHDPRGQVGAAAKQLAGKLDSLSGQTLALFPNSKPNADVLLEAVGRSLAERTGVKLTRVPAKNAAMPADDEVIDQLAKEVQAVLVGSAD